MAFLVLYLVNACLLWFTYWTYRYKVTAFKSWRIKRLWLVANVIELVSFSSNKNMWWKCKYSEHTIWAKHKIVGIQRRRSNFSSRQVLSSEMYLNSCCCCVEKLPFAHFTVTCKCEKKLFRENVTQEEEDEIFSTDDTWKVECGSTSCYYFVVVVFFFGFSVWFSCSRKQLKIYLWTQIKWLCGQKYKLTLHAVTKDIWMDSR